jgi:sulfatase modifying factor 1
MTYLTDRNDAFDRVQRLIRRWGSAVALLPLAVICVSAHAVTLDWVTVGDPGNAADTTGYGAVASPYRIGKYEVTIGQYAAFLNAAARTDTYSLYSPSMRDLNIAGISRAGVAGSYSYSVITNGGSSENRPITFVSWFDAARFANWMQNGQGSGSTETGAYTLNGATSGTAPAVNAGASFYIPTEDQWYKAAYYKGGGTNAGYWTYATQSDVIQGNVVGSGANQANYYPHPGIYSVTQSVVYSVSQNYLTDVGAFTGSQSAYGTFDQSGNVHEWNDLDGSASASRGFRGGSWGAGAFDISSFVRGTADPTYETGGGVGFRLASPIPAAVPEIDPAGIGSILALVTGVFGILERRRTKQG